MCLNNSPPLALSFVRNGNSPPYKGGRGEVMKRYFNKFQVPYYLNKNVL
jgi:hypothetical protein